MSNQFRPGASRLVTVIVRISNPPIHRRRFLICEVKLTPEQMTETPLREFDARCWRALTCLWQERLQMQNALYTYKRRAIYRALIECSPVQERDTPFLPCEVAAAGLFTTFVWVGAMYASGVGFSLPAIWESNGGDSRRPAHPPGDSVLGVGAPVTQVY